MSDSHEVVEILRSDCSHHVCAEKIARCSMENDLENLDDLADQIITRTRESYERRD